MPEIDLKKYEKYRIDAPVAEEKPPVDLSKYERFRVASINHPPDKVVYFPSLDTTRAYPGTMNEDEMGYDAQVELYGKPKSKFMLGMDMGIKTLKTIGEKEIELGRKATKGLGEFFPTTAATLVGNSMVMEGETAEIMAPQEDETTAALAGMPMAAIFRSVKGLAARFTDVDEKVADTGRKILDMAKPMLDKQAKEREDMTWDEKFAYDLGGATGSIFTSLALTWLTKKNSQSASLLFGQIAAGDTYMRGRESGKTPQEALKAARRNFGTEYLLEHMGLEIFTKYLRGSKTVVRGLIKAGSEFFQEAGQTLGSELSAKVGKFNEATWGDIVKDMGYSGLIGFIAAGPGAAVQVAKENRTLKGKLMNRFNLTEAEADVLIEKTVPKLVEATAPTVQKAMDTEAAELNREAQKIANEAKIVTDMDGKPVEMTEPDDKAQGSVKSEIAGEEGDISFDVSEFEAVKNDARERLKSEDFDITESIKPDEKGKTAAEKRLDEILDAKEKRAMAEVMLEQVTSLSGEFKGRIKDKVYEGQKIPRYFRTNNKNALAIDEALDEARRIGFGESMQGTSEFFDWLVLSAREIDKLKSVIAQSKAETGKKVKEETMLRRVIKSLEQGMKKGEQAAKKDVKAVQEEAIAILESSDLEAEDKAKFIRTIKNIQTEAQLEKAMPEIESRIKAIEEASKKNELADDIRKLSTDSLPLEYKDIINKLKSPFDLKRRSKKTLLQRGESKKFFDRLMEQGVELSEDQKDVLNEAEKMTLNEMSVGDLQNVHDQIMRLYHQGKLKGKLKTIRAAREVEAYVKGVVEGLKDTVNETERDSAIRVLAEQNGDLVGKTREFIDAYIAIHLRPELMYEMVGMSDVFNALVESDQTKDRNINKVAKALEEIHKDVNIGKAVHKKYTLGRFKGFTLDYAMFVYANSKNQGNYEHLLGSGFTAQEIEDFSKWLEKTQPKAKQAVDDMVRYYDQVQYAELDKVFSEMEGVHLGKEEGYFPIQNLEGVAQDKNIEKGILERAYVRKASPDKKFTKERVNSKAAFSKMSYFTSILRNMNAVQHYIAFAETVRDANRILSRPELKEAISKKFGDKWVEQFDKHLKDAAYGGAERYNDAINNFANSLRSNYALAVLGFNLTTVIKQPISWLQGAEYVGKANVIKATAEFMIHPLRTIKFAQDKSELVKNRAFTQEREFIEMMKSASRGNLAGQFGQMNLTEEAKKFSMAMIQASDLATVSIIFKGAYDKAISENMSEREAIFEAEKAIRRTQPMGGTLYLPTIFRGSDIQKLYTLFKNQPNQNFNLLWESQRNVRSGDISVPKWGMEQLMYAIIPGLLLGLISRKRLPKDAKEFMFDTLNQYLGALFLIGNVTNSMSSGYWGGLTPMEGLMDDMQRLLTGKKLETKMKGAARVGSALMGIPYIGLERIFTGRPFGGKKDGSRKRKTSRRLK